MGGAFVGLLISVAVLKYIMICILIYVLCAFIGGLATWIMLGLYLMPRPGLSGSGKPGKRLREHNPIDDYQ